MGQELLQELPHPGQVCAFTTLSPSGDILTGCEDGVIRVFTMDTRRPTVTEVREGREGTMLGDSSTCKTRGGERDDGYQLGYQSIVRQVVSQ